MRWHRAAAAVVLGVGILAMARALAAGNMAGPVISQAILQSGCIVGSDPAAGAEATEITCSPDITALNISLSSIVPRAGAARVAAGFRPAAFRLANLPSDNFHEAASSVSNLSSAGAFGIALPGTGAPLVLPVPRRSPMNKVGFSPVSDTGDMLQLTLSW